MRDWIVAADDRTGALETAAAMAGVVGAPVLVTVRAVPDAVSGVVDLGSRAVTAAAAAAAAMAADSTPSRWTAHKIDSTLRGHWAVELAARQRVLRRPVVLLPAWPAMGRTCRDGVVHVHGRPMAAVHDGLPVARRLTVDELAHGVGAEDAVWVDIADEAELAAAAAAVASLDALVAGPAGALGAVAAARFGTVGSPATPPLQPPVLVVCGSATEMAAAQVAALAAARPDVEVVAAPVAAGPLDPAVAAALAAEVRDRAALTGTLIVIGGDTAAAVLGDAPRLAGGFAVPGLPWSVTPGGDGPLVITKAGGFGDRDTLVRLLAGV